MAGDAERLRRYWSVGEGAALIAWGSPGDWTRCVTFLSKYMPGRAEGYCALLHKRNTGLWTGDNAHRSLAHNGTPTDLLETAVTLGIAHPDTLALATPKVTPEQDKARRDAYKKRVAANKARKAAKAEKGKAEAAASSGPGSGFNPTRAPAGSPEGGQFAAGPPRDEAAKAAQDNPEARKNYEALQGLDPAAAKAMLDGLNDKDLQDLSRAAYSFKSKDPKVVAQRIAIANALARRGQDVNDHGGLGKKSAGAKLKPKAAPATNAAPAKPAKPAARRTPRRPALRPTGRPTPGRVPTRRPAPPAGRKVAGGTQTALSNAEIDRLELSGPNVAARKQMAAAGEAMPDGSFPVRNLDDLRKAVAAFGRAAPEKRAAVKAHLMKRARLMGGESLIPADWH